MKLPSFSSPSPGLFLLGLIGHLVAVNGQSPTINPTDTATTPLPTIFPPGPGPGPGLGETLPAGLALNESLGGMAYGLHDRKLYIQGGNRSDNTVSTQLFMLDLSLRWEISRPVWSSLPNTNNINVSGVSGGFLSSGAFVVHSNNPPGVFSYNIQSGSWSNLNGPAVFAAGGPQVATATDNRTYFLSDGLVVDPQSTPQPLSPKQTLAPGLAVAWSSELKKVVTTVTNGSRVMDARTLDLKALSNGWISLNATGRAPSDRTSHCFVPVENDPTTFLLYGGKSGSIVFDELWSLSVTTAQWKQLPTSGSGRHSMACAVSGDTLVVWGGYIGDTLVVDTAPLLFNLTTNRWGAAEFVPTPSRTNIDPINPISPTPESKIPNPSSNVAAIAGGVAGGVVLIALVGFFLYRRRARGRSNKNAALSRNSMASKDDSGHAAEKEEFMEEDRERSLPSLSPTQLQQQQQHTLVLPRGGSPTAAPMGYPAVPFQQPPLPMHSRPMTSQSYTTSVGSSHSSPVLVIHSPFEDVNEANAKHPLLTPVQYTPATQHQPRPQDEVVDLMPITRSEAGSLHSRTNSVSSQHSLGRRATVRTGGRRDEEDDEDPEELDYLAEADQAILSEQDRVAILRFGNDSDQTCRRMDELFSSIAKKKAVVVNVMTQAQHCSTKKIRPR
ncbi:hypothetical protein BGZ81_008750 [Podila clonocystis]|nr:hypothetical protein BGZ81_008750 [Podila clonocystis]